MEKISCAIIRSGNIGTDLMIKIMRNAIHLTMGAMVGIDPNSDGLARAARLGIPVTHEGIEGLRKLPNYQDIGVVFDATSAGAHIHNNALLQKDGKKVVDLTPGQRQSGEKDFNLPLLGSKLLVMLIAMSLNH
jgi:acetaldehyde dehydrogenase